MTPEAAAIVVGIVVFVIGVITWKHMAGRSRPPESRKEPLQVPVSLPTRKPEPQRKALPPAQASPWIVPVESFSGSGEVYSVDLQNLTCRCKDFGECRTSFSPSDPRRCCKHIVRAMLEHGEVPDALEPYEDAFQFYAGYERGFPPDRNPVRGTVEGVEVEAWLPSSTTTNPWMDVFIGGRRYGLNLRENRWAFGEIPKGRARKIKTWVRSQI